MGGGGGRWRVGNPSHSVALSGTQWHSVALSRNQSQSVAITFSERTETQSAAATLSASECQTPSARITPRRPHWPLRSPAICTCVVISGHQWSSVVISSHQWSSEVIKDHQPYVPSRPARGMLACRAAARVPTVRLPNWNLRGTAETSRKRRRTCSSIRLHQHAISMQSACNQPAISMPSACHQHAISMQPAPECNQHATREQSACSQGALGVREMGEEPSECNQHAIRMQSACNQHACSAYGKWEKSHSGARRSLAGGADALWGTLSVACETESSACTQHALGLSMALSMHSACNQISILARRRPRGPACTGAPGASTADRGAAASSCA